MTSSPKFRAGLLQMRSGRTVDANIADAVKLAREAKAAGADYIQTPEMTNLMEQSGKALFAAIAEEERDPSLAAFRELARELKVYFHVGSLAIKASPEKAANRSFLIDPAGDLVARYDKIHMFDVELGAGESYRESNNYRPGESAVLADLPWGRMGLTVCYDLRFPSLYRALAEAGAQFLAIPAAFTKITGEAHWNVLMRARAIETGKLCAGGRARRPARKRPRDVRPQHRRRSVGKYCRGRRYRARRHHGRDRSGSCHKCALAHSLAATWTALRAFRAERPQPLASRG